MRIARFLVSYELLQEALHLPWETTIHAVRDSTDAGDRCEIVVEHPDLQDVDVLTYESLPFVMPEWRKQAPVEFVSWGQR